MKNVDHDPLIESQMAYYRARAAEYDQWFLRQGRYDRGEANARQWFAEVQQVKDALSVFDPAGDVLEFASGTGWWTEELAKYAERITAVDASPETISINKAKLQSGKVSYVQANIFEWEPDRQYDVVFFSYWLSHVPPERFEPFWELVRRALKENGRVFLIDSLYTAGTTAKDQQLKTEQDTILTRHLNNGESYEIVKVFYTPDSLSEKLRPLNWASNFTQTNTFILYGSTQAYVTRDT